MPEAARDSGYTVIYDAVVQNASGYYSNFSNHTRHHQPLAREECNLTNPQSCKASDHAREVAAERHDSFVPEVPLFVRSAGQGREPTKGLVSTENLKLPLSSYALTLTMPLLMKMEKTTLVWRC